MVNTIKLNTGASVKDYNKVSDWLSFETPDKILISSGKVDIGQHISTTLALISSRELEVDINSITVKKLNTDVTPNEGITASSLSVPNSGTAIRSASIIFKKSFLDYASKSLNLNKNNLKLDNGVVKDPDSNASMSYWDFSKTDEFLKLTIPENIEIFDQTNVDYDLHVETKFINSIVKGEYKFLHDLKFDDMLHARIIRPPSYSHKFLSIDDKVNKYLNDHNLELYIKNSFIAVLGVEEYEVVKSLNLLKNSIEWEQINKLANDKIFNLIEQNEKDSLVVKRGGEAFHEDVPEIKSYDDNFKTITTEFNKPYLMHGSIGPSASCSIYKNGKFEIYSHSQAIYALKSILTNAFNLDENNITLHFMPGAGCYGHNGADDVTYEAALLSKEFENKHVLLKWTREDENCWEPYGSASKNKLSATLDDKNRIIYWSSEAYSDTYLTRPMVNKLENFVSQRFLNNDFKKYKASPRTGAHMGIHRNLDPIYNFKETRLVKNLVHDLPLRTSALRTLGAFANTTATETFMDELSIEANIDPFEFRINHLDDKRAIDLLNDLKMHMEKDNPLENSYRGIAFSRYKNSASYCAVGVELMVTDNVEIELKQAWITVDAGEIAFKEGIEAQVEGGFIQAASWSLYEQVDFDNNEILSKDWDNYKIIEFDNIPLIKTSVINRVGYPYLGVGEAVAGPTGASISNAIRRALGERITTMPFSQESIKKQLLG